LKKKKKKLFFLTFFCKKKKKNEASIINGAGYIGAILSGVVTGSAADSGGWYVVFIILTGIAIFATLIQLLYWIIDLKEINAIKGPEGERLLPPTQ